MNLNKKTYRLVFSGLFVALSVVLYFLEIPLIPPFSYLKADLSDLPAALAACLMGPLAGVAVELVKNVIHLFVRGFADSMGYGDLMNFLVGCAYVVPFSLVYRALSRKKTFSVSLLLGGAAGLAATVIVGAAGNFALAPMYFKVLMHVTLSRQALLAAIGGATILNVVKPVIVTFLCLLLQPLLARLAARIPGSGPRKIAS